MLARQRARVALLPLVEAFEARKRAAGAIDYADQVAYAARIAVAAAEVGRRERARWKVVLLDEYQDTSVGQLRMLEALFGGDTGHPVLAVGDPRQSIYGWRGASAGTIERFDRTFPGRAGRRAERLTLATSWRNDRSRPRRRQRRLGDAAAARAAAARPRARADRRRAARSPSGCTTPSPRRPRRSPTGWPRAGTDDGPARSPGGDGRAARPSRCSSGPASSCRGIAAALRERGRAGRGRRPRRAARGARGLRRRRDPHRARRPDRRRRARPAAHRCALADRPARPRRAGGARPARSSTSRRAAPGRRRGGAPVAEAPAERGSIVEALDDLGDPRRLLARRATAGCAGSAASWRTCATGWASRCPTWSTRSPARSAWRPSWPARPDVSPAGARAHLDALHGVAAEFTELAELPSLPAFLGYLRDAEERERGLEPGEVAVNPEAVQLLTGHSAKGLEWDVVAVPGHDHGPVPGQDRHQRLLDQGPGRRARRPAAHRPRGAARGCGCPCPAPATRPCVEGRRSRTTSRSGRTSALAEEIRLGYVAVTRARHLLLCSGSWWRDGVKPCGPSSLLHHRAGGLRGRRRRGRALGARRRPTTRPTPRWRSGRSASGRPTRSPSGRRRALTAAAELVARRRAAPARPRARRSAADDPLVEQWVRDADLLLRERARHASPTVDVPLPSHLSVSALVTLRRDPAELARRLRRPMPAAPAPQARRGTAFHAWLEERFGAARLVDLDELPGSGDEFAAPDGALAELQEAFLASEWADRQPVEVEVPFETPLGPLTLRGRIDAVFADADGGYEVIDWKTGPPPSGAELAAAGVQLAAYRLGWSRLTGVPVERVSAGFHHVAAGRHRCARSTCSTRPACSPWSPAPPDAEGPPPDPDAAERVRRCLAGRQADVVRSGWAPGLDAVSDRWPDVAADDATRPGRRRLGPVRRCGRSTGRSSRLAAVELASVRPPDAARAVDRLNGVRRDATPASGRDRSAGSPPGRPERLGDPRSAELRRPRSGRGDAVQDRAGQLPPAPAPGSSA